MSNPNPQKYEGILPWENEISEKPEAFRPDDRSGAVYLQDDRLRFVTDVALVTQRPLLIRGEPGSGKSSYAAFVARNLNARYYEHTVTGRTEAKDLLWQFDALRRLRDAQSKAEQLHPKAYISPGPLWWAFDREQALEYALGEDGVESEPFANENSVRHRRRAVVLIDEIDKADPNVPNDLLEVLGLNQFRVPEVNLTVKRQLVPEGEELCSFLTVITTNQERDLPDAFLRRCIVHTLEEPEDEKQQIKRRIAIAKLHHPFLDASGDVIAEAIAQKCVVMRQENKRKRRPGPSIAEFLDAVRFCVLKGVRVDSDEWKMVETCTLMK